MSGARGLTQFIQKMRERASQWWGTIVQADSSDEIDAIVLEDRVLYSATPFPLDSLDGGDVASQPIDQHVLDALAALEVHFAEMTTNTNSASSIATPILETAPSDLGSSSDGFDQDSQANEDATSELINASYDGSHTTIVSTDDTSASVDTSADSHPVDNNQDTLVSDSYDITATTDNVVDSADSIRYEVAFVDASLDDLDQLISELQANADDNVELDIVLIDQNQDGILAIGQFLSSSQFDFDAVHIVTHGNADGFQLGSIWLDSGASEFYASELALWKDGLTSDADLLIYGCSVASTSDFTAMACRARCEVRG